MGSLGGKSPASTYKSLLKVVDETNGVSSSTSKIEDGEGTASCLAVSDDRFLVQPQNDNTTDTLKVKDKIGTGLLAVDTSNSCVRVGATQTYANSQILTFSAYRIVPVAGTHYFVPCGGQAHQTTMAEQSNGTGLDPDTTFDAGDATDELVNMLFYAPVNITIDGVTFMVSTDTDTDTTVNVHLYKYTIVNAGGTTDGRMTGGTLLANGQAVNVDRSVVKTVSASIDSSSVSSGEVIACFVENVTNGDDINLRVQVLYHIN